MFAHGFLLQVVLIAKRGGTVEGRQDVQAFASFSTGMLESFSLFIVIRFASDKLSLLDLGFAL
jgi:hypothetical protein